MKKLLLAAVVALAFTSCSKKGDYTCTCSTTTNGTVYEYPSVEIHDSKESDAEDKCTDLEVGGNTCTLEKN